MKRTIFFLFALTLGTTALAVTPPHKTDYVPTTTATPVNCVEIPSDFAKPELYNRSLLDALKGKPVKRVELWYTRYKKSPSFNQQALNDKRVKQLQAAFPELRDPNIEWVWKEQTAAVTEEDASKCFHGFRLFTESEEALWTNEFHIPDAANPGEKIQVDNSKGRDFVAKSGTVVHIPAGAVADSNGNPVKGNYTVTYTEYRDPAQIAFSGLPMTLLDHGDPFMMNSAGMYEIRGTQNGNPLQLTQAITVDFNATAKLDDLNFYALDQQTGKWVNNGPIGFDQPATMATLRESPTVNSTSDSVPVYPTYNRADIESRAIRTIYKGSKNSVAASTLGDSAWASYDRLKKENPAFIRKCVIKDNPENKTVESHSESTPELIRKIFRSKFMAMDAQWQMNLQQDSITNKQIETWRNVNTVIGGLQSPKFGVYNCDQQNRMGPTISLKPQYIDQSTGKVVEQAMIACIIDRKINASLSFNPMAAACNPKSPSEIILFTLDKKVYHVNAAEAQKIGTGTFTGKLEMKDISAEVKDSEDLKGYLKL